MLESCFGIGLTLLGVSAWSPARAMTTAGFLGTKPDPTLKGLVWCPHFYERPDEIRLLTARCMLGCVEVKDSFSTASGNACVLILMVCGQ